MKYRDFLIILTIFAISLTYRVLPLNQKTPFWIDEFSSGVQAKLINTEKFNLPMLLDSEAFEKNNYLTHFLISLSFKVSEVSETSAKFPFALIGALTCVIIFLLTLKIANRPTAIAAAVLLSFSYFEISWSIQARGYVLQQLLGLLAYFFYLSEFKNKKLKIFIIFTILLFGLLTHIFFIFIILSLIAKLIVDNYKKINFKKMLPLSLAVFILLAIIFTKFSFINSIIIGFTSGFISLFNNVWYYHQFLWVQQTLVICLFLLGTIVFLRKKPKLTLFLLFPIIFNIVFICFAWGHYMTKYVLPFYPFLIIFAAIGIDWISKNLVKTLGIPSKFDLASVLIFCFFIIINGNEFVFKPQSYYSINRFSRDIAIVDYDRIYEIIKQDSSSIDDIAIIDTWPDRAKWYLGSNISSLYWFRWENSGFQKSTSYLTNQDGEKHVLNSGSPKIRLIASFSDLQLAMSKYSKGFIWIDDSSLPQDVQDYARLNFKKELEIDSYGPELLENPYSKWPGTLYSWGFDNEK